MKRRLALLALGALLVPSAALAASLKNVDKDLDGDGRKESKIFFDERNIIQKMHRDMNSDGLPDEWVLFAEGRPVSAEKDSNHDGKVDTWIDYEPGGRPTRISRDKRRKDGKPDTWSYLKNGQIYMREYDRNFDGRPDFRTMEDPGHRLLESQYDDNFDGTFERKVTPLPHGSPGRPEDVAKTSKVTKT